MWFIIFVSSVVVLGVLIGLLLRCEWSPVVRRHYWQLGWEDGMRWQEPYTPQPPPASLDGIDRYMAELRLRSSIWYCTDTRPKTELDMSRRRFDYYMTGYEQALDYKRQREGIIATRRSELDRARRLDHEIRQAHHELMEDA